MASEKLVDRLLNDTRYGERWARFRLDLAGYADTAGYEGDPDLPHAWRYRDYVIDAFNNNKPYDQFLLEQIAGDELHEVMGAGELPEPKPEFTTAMTFLRLAPTCLRRINGPCFVQAEHPSSIWQDLRALPLNNNDWNSMHLPG